MDRLKDKALDYFTSCLRAKLGSHIQRIILFGSRARGDNVSKTIKEIINDAAGETLYRHDAVISAFPVSRDKFKRNTLNPFFINVKKEGMSI